MKTNLLLFSFLLLVLNASSQEKSVKLFEDNVGAIKIKYDKKINLSSNDTTYFLILLFQNQKYTYISDFSAIGFDDNIDLQGFIKDLEIAQKEKESDGKVSMKWANKNYKINLFEFTKNIYIEEGGTSSGYTTVSNKQLLKLISILKRIRIGNDMVLPE